AGGKNVQMVHIPEEWKNIEISDTNGKAERPEVIVKVVDVINAQKGDSLPVSSFTGAEDGTFPLGTSAYEKRGIAVSVPEWKTENCIQCNQCAYVCPHAAIRPFLLTDEEAAAAPDGTETRVATPSKMYNG